MPYLNYNLPIQRTGFRPYGHTNPWAAVQLSGISLGRPRQVFSEPGGRRLGLGQWQSGFSPWVLHGIGQIACDPTDVFGSCYDPTAPITGPAPAGSPAGSELPAYYPESTPSSTGGGDCINAASGLPVPCPGTSAGTVSLGPGASPRVPVPPGSFPSTSPVYQTYPTTPGAGAPYGQGYGTTQGCPTGYSLSQGRCLPAATSQLTTYLPWVFGAAVVAALFGLMKK